MPQGTIASGGRLGAGRIPGRNCTGTDTCSCTYTDDTEETVDDESGDECSALDRFDTSAVIMADIDGMQTRCNLTLSYPQMDSRE